MTDYRTALGELEASSPSPRFLGRLSAVLVWPLPLTRSTSMTSCSWDVSVWAAFQAGAPRHVSWSVTS
jgi:hypothetical protein